MGSSIGCLNLAIFIFIFMRLDWGNLPLRLRNMVPVVFVAESTLGPVKANFLLLALARYSKSSSKFEKMANLFFAC